MHSTNREKDTNYADNELTELADASGVGVLYALITSLVSEYKLSLTLGVLTYSVSILLTFGVSLIVSRMVAGKNKHIDMVEALKGRE